MILQITSDSSLNIQMFFQGDIVFRTNMASYYSMLHSMVRNKKYLTKGKLAKYTPSVMVDGN